MAIQPEELSRTSKNRGRTGEREITEINLTKDGTLPVKTNLTVSDVKFEVNGL